MLRYRSTSFIPMKKIVLIVYSKKKDETIRMILIKQIHNLLIMRKSYYCFILFTFTLFSCGKYDIAKNTPECIKGIIESLDKDSVCDNPKVDEYLFQNELVYVAGESFCGPDMQSIVYDEDCEIIGALGGIVGNSVINGEKFSNAEHQRIVWKK